LKNKAGLAAGPGSSILHPPCSQSSQNESGVSPGAEFWLALSRHRNNEIALQLAWIRDGSQKMQKSPPPWL
jgi:hypothetical protein